jgi:hypothetical protein
VTPADSIEQRVARLGRAIGRAASDAPSESRQAALEGLARFSADLSAHFASEEACAGSAASGAERARLRGELAALGERARAAGDWPESWRAVATAFDRFARALEAHERSTHPNGG